MQIDLVGFKVSLLPWERDLTTFFSFMKGTCISFGGLPHSLAPNMLASRDSP